VKGSFATPKLDSLSAAAKGSGNKMVNMGILSALGIIEELIRNLLMIALVLSRDELQVKVQGLRVNACE
jgi:hypothetical protein